MIGMKGFKEAMLPPQEGTHDKNEQPSSSPCPALRKKRILGAMAAAYCDLDGEKKREDLAPATIPHSTRRRKTAKRGAPLLSVDLCMSSLLAAPLTLHDTCFEPSLWYRLPAAFTAVPFFDEQLVHALLNRANEGLTTIHLANERK